MIARRLLPLVGIALLTACPRLDPMQRQPKYKAYQSSEYYDDGLAMRAPPAGTVPYHAIVDPAILNGRGPDGKALATSPLPATDALLATGRKRFDINCAVCHGTLGDGMSQVAMNMSLRRPPSLHLYRDRPDGYLYQVISEGFGVMPSYAQQLSVEERWAVVAYVRALQLSQHAALTDLPPALRERVQKEAR